MFSVSGGEEWVDQSNDNEYYAVAARYKAEAGDFLVDGRLGYSWISGESDILAGSIAGLHQPSGLSLAFASGGRRGDEAPEYLYTKIGYQRAWFDFGRTFLSVDYYGGSDFVIDGSDSDSFGVAIVQKLDDQNIELFATYRTHEFDADGEDFDDIDVFALGARWKF